MKKNIIYLIVFLLLLNISYGYWIMEYNFTFDSGSDEGFTESSCGFSGHPDYSSDNFRSGDGNIAQADNELNFNWSEYNLVNFTFDVFSDGNNYVKLTLYDSSDECTTGYQGIYIHSGTNTIYWTNCTDINIGGLAEINRYTILFYTNGTTSVYENYTYLDSCDNNGYPSDNYDYLYAVSRNANMGIDNITIQYNESVPTPELNLNTNLINNTINYNQDSLTIFFNGSFADQTTTYANCTLFNDTNFMNLSENIDLNNNNNWSIDTFNQATEYFFRINCSNFENYDEIGLYHYSIDTIIPMLQTTFVNNSQYVQNDILSLYVNFSDSNLYAYNITFKDSNNIPIENIFAENLTVTFAENSSSMIVSNVGNFSINLEVWDSHTINIIPTYDWTKYVINATGVIYKGIKFNNNIFNISSPDYDKINDFSLEKKIDRYVFIFNFSELTEITLYLGTRKNIIYLPMSNYKGHFILGFKHWIDFNSENIENLQISYKSNYDVWEIKFTPKTEQIIFNSIGDLNYYSEIYYYDVISETTLNTALLQSIDSHLNSTDENINKIGGGINMLWFWGVLLLCIFLPIILNGIDKFKDIELINLTYLISAIIFLILSYFLNTEFDYLNEKIRGLITLVLIILSMAYGTLESEK